MYATNFYEHLILNTFNGIDALGVQNLYVGLYLTSPTETGTGGTEVQYGTYTRQAITFSAPFLESGNMRITNENALTWPAPDLDIGEINYIGIHDSAVRGSGNMYLYGQLTTPLRLLSGQEPTQRAGDILYYTTGNISQAFATNILNILRNITLLAMTPYAALYNSLPSQGGTELSGTGYIRPQIPFSTPVEVASGHAQIQNTSLVSFPIPLSSWGTWAASVVMSGATGGIPLVGTATQIPEVITENINVQFPAGNITVSMH